MGKTIQTENLIFQLEKKVNEHLDLSISVFQNLSQELLLKSSSTGGWSIAECIWHLNSYGYYYLPKIKDGLEKNQKTNPQFQSGWLGSYLTRMMEPTEKTKKFKAFKDHVPPNELNPYSEVSQFINQLELLVTLLQKARHSDLNKIYIPISISKWIKLKLGDVFQFLIAHNDRHVLQAFRNIPEEILKQSAL
jgi:DinB superfamily